MKKYTKKYFKEIVILLLQLFMFYIFPLFAGPTDTMGMIVLIILSTFLLSLLIGCISKQEIKYFYSIIVALLFIPTIFLYYNKSAFVYILVYLVVSKVGFLIGLIIKMIVENIINVIKKKGKKDEKKL